MKTKRNGAGGIPAILLWSALLFSLYGAQPCLAAAPDGWSPAQIEMITPNAVGGGQDITTRILGEAWSKRLGIPFVYSNKTGASGQIGYTFFLTRPRDGSALLSTNLSSASIMYKEQKPPFVWEEDLEWLGIFGIDPGVFFVSAKSSVTSLRDLIEEAKKRKVTVGISFWASPDNLLVQQIIQQTGAQLEVIPFGAANDVVTQVIGGHVDLGFAKATVASNAGDALRYLAISMNSNPMPEMTNNAPTVDEALGTDTLVEASYRAVNVHKAFKDQYPERFEWVRQAFEDAKDDPAVIEAMRKVGVAPELIVDWTPEQLRAQTQAYWDAYEQFKDIYQQKRK